MDFAIAPLTDTPAIRAGLRDLLIETVANNGSVHFMHPLALREADAFWDLSLAAMMRGERILLGAFEGTALVATVTLQLLSQPNALHKGEIGKMMTRVSHRRKGIARALLREAEHIAVTRGKTLLVLDTAAEEATCALYEAHGFQLAGAIPGYALTPHGTPMAAKIYWKQIGG